MGSKMKFSAHLHCIWNFIEIYFFRSWVGLKQCWSFRLCKLFWYS